MQNVKIKARLACTSHFAFYIFNFAFLLLLPQPRFSLHSLIVCIAVYSAELDRGVEGFEGFFRIFKKLLNTANRGIGALDERGVCVCV